MRTNFFFFFNRTRRNLEGGY